jgi:V8-like Glu-specific endopeptidase
MKLPGSEWKEIRDALCDAFSTPRELERLLRDCFGKNIYEIIASGGSLPDMVDDIIRWFSARDQIDELIHAAFTKRPAHSVIQKLAQKWIHVPLPPESDYLERFFRQANSLFDPEIWHYKFRDIINQVCQVEVKTRSGGKYFGTGVLIAPDIILTNYHVIETVADPAGFHPGGKDATPGDVIIRFDNRKSTSGYIQAGVEFHLQDDWLAAFSPYHALDLQGQPDWNNPIENELDFALLRVAGSPGEQNLLSGSSPSAENKRGWVKLNQRVSSGVTGMGLMIVQHPEGGMLKVGLDTEAVLAVNASESRIKHKVNTANGSSGAPCFNLNWDLVAIHQAGIPSTKTNPGYNVAIPISKIIAYLKENGLVEPLGLSLN